MSNLTCNCRTNCIALAIISSLIVGIITAFLRLTAVITLTPAFLWVTLGIAVVYLAVILLTSSRTEVSNFRDCLCPTLSVLLFAILGTILTSLVLLAIEFVATSIIGAIITGALLAFLWLIFTSTACLAKCLAICEE